MGGSMAGRRARQEGRPGTGPGERPEEIQAAWHQERPDVDVSSIALITPLWRLGEAVMANRAHVLAGHELDQPTLDVLGTLRRSGAPYRLSAGELSRRCRVTPGATTQRVARLEELGYVRRVREEPDRRTVHVELTTEGRSRLDAVFADVMAGDERMLEGLGPAQRRSLEALLGAWLALVEGRDRS